MSQPCSAPARRLLAPAGGRTPPARSDTLRSSHHRPRALRLRPLHNARFPSGQPSRKADYRSVMGCSTPTIRHTFTVVARGRHGPTSGTFGSGNHRGFLSVPRAAPYATAANPRPRAQPPRPPSGERASVLAQLVNPATLGHAEGPVGDEHVEPAYRREVEPLAGGGSSRGLLAHPVLEHGRRGPRDGCQRQ